MGKHVDELSKTLDVKFAVLGESSDTIAKAAANYESMASRLTKFTTDLGLYGAAGDAAAQRFDDLRKQMLSAADQTARVAAGIEQGRLALADAVEAYHALPSATLSLAQRVAILGDTSPGGTGGTAADYYALDATIAALERDREAAAAKAMTNLTAALQDATWTLQGGDQTSRTGGPIPPSGGPGTSTGRGGSSTGPDAGSTFGSGLSSSSSDGGVDVGALGAGSAWSTSSGAEASAGSGSGWTGAATAGGVGGYTGVTGGSTSSDGSMGGYVPGAGLTGGTSPIGSTWATSGSNHSSWDPSVSGTAAGGGALAGGLVVGGAALGAAGLGRLGGGSGMYGIGGIGAGGLGAGGGIGGSGVGGRLGGAGAAPGAGLGSGSGAGGAQGGAAMLGGGAPGGGAGGSSKQRRQSGQYRAPRLGDFDEPEHIDLGPGARAGSRTHPNPPIVDEDPDAM